MSNELNNPKICLCPSDGRPTGSIPTDFISPAAGFNNTTLSYFAGLQCDETFPAMVLSGDRNICDSYGKTTLANPIVAPDTTTSGYGAAEADATGGYVVSIPSVNVMSAANNQNYAWTQKMHNQTGNFGLADGSVQKGSTGTMHTYFARTGDINNPPNVLAFP